MRLLRAHCKQSKTEDGKGLGMRLGKPGNETRIDLCWCKVLFIANDNDYRNFGYSPGGTEISSHLIQGANKS